MTAESYRPYRGCRVTPLAQVVRVCPVGVAGGRGLVRPGWSVWSVWPESRVVGVAGGWLAAREAGRAAAGRLAGRWIRASIWKTGYGFSRLGRADLMGVVYGVPEQL